MLKSVENLMTPKVILLTDDELIRNWIHLQMDVGTHSVVIIQGQMNNVPPFKDNIICAVEVHFLMISDFHLTLIIILFYDHCDHHDHDLHNHHQ